MDVVNKDISYTRPIPKTVVFPGILTNHQPSLLMSPKYKKGSWKKWQSAEEVE